MVYGQRAAVGGRRTTVGELRVTSYEWVKVYSL